jgi:hypothetical protein
MARPKSFAEPTMIVSVRMPASLHDQVVRLAEVEHRSLSQQLIVLIEKGLQEADTSARPAARRTETTTVFSIPLLTG